MQDHAQGCGTWICKTVSLAIFVGFVVCIQNYTSLLNCGAYLPATVSMNTLSIAPSESPIHHNSSDAMLHVLYIRVVSPSVNVASVTRSKVKQIFMLSAGAREIV